jgi:pheromone shutdown protein TraB
VLKLLGMDPGLEFKVAMAEAKAQGAKLVYGDANVQETLKKLSASIKLQARAHAGSCPACDTATRL